MNHKLRVFNGNNSSNPPPQPNFSIGCDESAGSGPPKNPFDNQAGVHLGRRSFRFRQLGIGGGSAPSVPPCYSQSFAWHGRQAEMASAG